MSTFIDDLVRRIHDHNKYQQTAQIQNRNRVVLYGAGWHQQYKINLALKGEYVGMGRKYRVRKWGVRNEDGSTPYETKQSQRFVADPNVFDMCAYRHGSVVWRVDAKEKLLRSGGTLYPLMRTWYPWTMFLPKPIHSHFVYATRHADGYHYLAGFRNSPATVINPNLVLYVGENGVDLVEGYEPIPKEPVVTQEKTNKLRYIMKRLRHDLLHYEPMRMREHDNLLSEDDPIYPIFGEKILEEYQNNKDETRTVLVNWALAGEADYDPYMHARLVALASSYLYSIHTRRINFDFKHSYRTSAFMKSLRTHVYTP